MKWIKHNKQRRTSGKWIFLEGSVRFSIVKRRRKAGRDVEQAVSKPDLVFQHKQILGVTSRDACPSPCPQSFKICVALAVFQRGPFKVHSS